MRLTESWNALQTALYNTGHFAAFLFVVSLGAIISAIPLIVLYLTRQRNHKPEPEV